MIPQYLNEEHIKAEKEVTKVLEQAWHCKVDHQYKFSSYDCVAHRDNKPLAFVELRVLNYGWTDLDSIMISLTKLIAGKQQTELTKIKSLFVVKWKQSDMIGWVDVNKLSGKPDFRVTLKGTNRLNDSNEIEVCRYIPVLDFNVIRTWK
jgi:hypothetical protein